METCKFNEKRDIRRVVSGLAVNITETLKTGIVRDNTDVVDYNNLDDPSHIVGRVESVFDAIDAQRAIKKYGKHVSTSAVAKEITTPPSPASAPSSD